MSVCNRIEPFITSLRSMPASRFRVQVLSSFFSLKNLSVPSAWFLVVLVLLSAGSSTKAQDVTPPAPVTLRFVDVNPTNNDVMIRWNPSSSVDVAGYYIYKNIDGYWIRIGSTVTGTTTFTNAFVAPPLNVDEDSRANTQIEQYRVSAHDGPNESVLCDPHQTIYLQSFFDSCQGTVVLSWNHYETWSDGLLGYEVYTRKDGAPEELIAFVLPGSNSYLHRTIEPESNYWYYVKAISGSGNFTSRSNARTIFTDMPRYPILFNANFASVIETNRVQLSFTVDLNADVLRYKILRSSNGKNGDYDTIATVNLNALEGNLLVYDDYINTNQTHYYKLVAINTCNVPFYNTTNVASNMVLTATETVNMENAIVWNNYEDWLGGIEYFDLYRIMNDQLFKIASIEYGDTVFVDDLKDFMQDPQYALLNNPNFINPSGEEYNPYLAQPVLDGNVCYYVKAVETNDNPFNIKGESLSSVSCVSMQPKIWIPNAFSPNSDGINEYWIPYVSFVGWNQYQLYIFDRFGAIQWETSNPKEAWNGRTPSGQPLPSDMYRYLLRIEAADGDIIERSGSVYLIK